MDLKKIIGADIVIGSNNNKVKSGQRTSNYNYSESIRNKERTKTTNIALIDNDDILRKALNIAFYKSRINFDIYTKPEYFAKVNPEKYQHIFIKLEFSKQVWGTELAFYLRSEKQYQGNIIAISERIDYWDLDDLNDIGFNSIIPKPLHLTNILNIANGIYSKRTQRLFKKDFK